MPPFCRVHHVLALSMLALSGCSNLPDSGPSLVAVTDAPTLDAHGIRIVMVDAAVARELQSRRRPGSFAATFGVQAAADPLLGAGDAVEVTIWEAPPATLFIGATDLNGSVGGHATALPPQVIGGDGSLRVPFAGLVPVLGLRPQDVADEVVHRLTGKANRPQALVRVVRNGSSMVTVVGEVTQSLRVPLTSSGERLLDALAAAGGVRQPTNKMTIRLTRGSVSSTMPLDALIADPRENVALHGGDVVTALHKPYAFTALGATGRNEEIEFEAQGISLAQALARSGGLADQRSDARGVFVFRYEQSGPQADAEAQPVVYRIDLKDPSSLFAAQQFEIRPRDLLYVANAPAAELQKFLNLLLPLVTPAAAALYVRN